MDLDCSRRSWRKWPQSIWAGMTITRRRFSTGQVLRSYRPYWRFAMDEPWSRTFQAMTAHMLPSCAAAHLPAWRWLKSLRQALWKHRLKQNEPALVIVTTVTSSLARLEDSDSRSAIDLAKQAGATVFLDEAYGARLRPVLHGGAKSLQLGADLAVTNADKAGLSGPRAGILVGRQDAVVNVQARAAELGQEARAPIAAGALRSLQDGSTPSIYGRKRRTVPSLPTRWKSTLAADMVRRSDLGPAIGEEDILADMMSRRDVSTRQASYRPRQAQPSECSYCATSAC